jgi:hypothetical protein
MRAAALVVAGILAIVAAARCSGVAAGRDARDQQVADSAAAAAVHRVAQRRRAAIAAGRIFISTEAPHVEAQAASDRVFARNDVAIAAALVVRDAALAAAADTARALPALRADLRRAADQISVLTVALQVTRDTLLEERATAATRIATAVAAARAQDALVVAQDELDGARQVQLEVAQRRPSWLRRAVRASCALVSTAGGAGLGAMAGGVGGAIAGAVTGHGAGAIACR